ncbi:MAG TPA: hypothetical protein ENK91_10335 [Bacteroidetes bacterium]|nr:hypothetical protein [Bacteroidota bacterium]HHH54046.1 hypothetical protein [Bacteroidota bacterium]
MGFDEFSRTNKQNLKLRSFYRRYFVWGSKEKPGFDLDKRLPSTKTSSQLKKSLELASSKRRLNVILTLLIFLLLIILVALFVNLI